MLAIGMIKSYGILYEEMLDYFDSSAGSTAFIASTANFIQHGGGIYNIYAPPPSKKEGHIALHLSVGMSVCRYP